MDDKNMKQKGYTTKSVIDQPDESKAFPLALILAVVTFPLWIGLVAAIGGTIIGIAVSIVAGGIGFAVAGFSLLITAYSVGGFSGGLVLTGVGFLLFALTMLTLILFVVFCGQLIPWLVKCIIKIANKLVVEKE
jgi:hypothetical protein